MKSQITMAFCKAKDQIYFRCPFNQLIQAIGNFRPVHPDETIFIKYCKCYQDKKEKCKNRKVLSKFPTLPIYFTNLCAHGIPFWHSCIRCGRQI